LLQPREKKEYLLGDLQKLNKIKIKTAYNSEYISVNSLLSDLDINVI